MFDVVFISYDEPNADENWNRLKMFAPHAIHVHGVKGIPQVHIQAAKRVMTSHFFTVDGDNWVYDDFNWGKVVDFQKDDKRIHVWGCQNIVNGLQYGYGGIKLWPKDHIENIKEYSVDFTTSVASRGFRIHEQIASDTIFNNTPFNSWKSAFRECTKLAGNLINNSDPRTENRLRVWMSIGEDVKNGVHCLLGARQGTLFALKNQNDVEMLAKINDFDWLRERFETTPKHYQNHYLIANLAKYGFDVEDFSKEQSIWMKKVLYNL